MRNIPFRGEWEPFPQQLQFFAIVIDSERCFSCQQPYFSSGGFAGVRQGCPGVGDEWAPRYEVTQPAGTESRSQASACRSLSKICAISAELTP